MRRMQTNLSYITAVIQSKPHTLPGPALMTSYNPQNAPLAELYGKLQQQFPGWRGAPGKFTAASPQQNQAGQQSVQQKGAR
jgi:hypothetical protein